MSRSRKRSSPNRPKTAAAARIESLRRIVAKFNRMDIQLLDRLAAGTLSLEPVGPLAGEATSDLAKECLE